MPDVCECQVRRLGGTVVLVGLLLGVLVDRWFLAIVGVAAVNLLQSSFTGLCPAEYFLPGCSGGDGAAGTDPTVE
jgi:hypothetical protein